MLQHLLVKVTVTNDTYSGKGHTHLGIRHILTPFIGFHGNIPRWGTSQLGILLISRDLVCFNINELNLLRQMILIVETDIFMLVLSIFQHI